MEWETPISITALKLKCDTNVKRNIMMCKDSNNKGIYRNGVSDEILKSLELEAQIKGKWVNLGRINKNRTRLIKFPFDTIKTTAIRLQLKETYGYRNAKLFEVRCYG